MPFLTIHEFEVIPADAGSKIVGPGVFDEAGHRLGQLRLVLNKDEAKELKEAIEAEYGVWNSETGKRELKRENGTRGKHRE
jgi:hypothetical protein